MPALPSLTAQASIYPTSRYSYRAVPVQAVPASPQACYIVCGPCENCTKTCETICGSISTTHTESCCPPGPANSVQTCVGGVCGWQCDAGYLTCGSACCQPGYGCCSVDGVPTCVDISDNNSNCGSCGNACQAGYGCCIVDGYWTCVNLSTNGNCGSCGNTCTGGMTCVDTPTGWACQCPSGQTNCNGTCIDTATDNSHCGGCPGQSCGGGTSCVNGTCQCPSGLANCNGTCVDLDTDDSNCFKCGNNCNGGTCVDGNCNCPASPPYSAYPCQGQGYSCCVPLQTCCAPGSVCGQTPAGSLACVPA